MIRVLMAQIGIGAALTAAIWGFRGQLAGYSALLGVLTCVLPNAFLALRLAMPRRDPGGRGLMRAAWVGELGKLALTVLLFGMIFAYVRPLSAAALFAGFIVAQLATFAGLLLRDNDTKRTGETVNGE